MKKHSSTKMANPPSRIATSDVPCWAVVTAQINDGHGQNSYFIASTEGQVDRYANSVSPLIVSVSYYSSQDEAEEFVTTCLDGYAEIKPIMAH